MCRRLMAPIIKNGFNIPKNGIRKGNYNTEKLDMYEIFVYVVLHRNG